MRQRKVFSALDRISGFFKFCYECRKIFRLLRKDCINRRADNLAVRWLCIVSQPLVIGYTMRLGSIDDRQLMFRADQVAEFTDGFGAVPKVVEFSPAVKCGRVPDDVVVNVVPVDVCADNKSVLAFEKPLSEFISDAIGFLGGHFAGLEGLADLIGDDIMLLLASGEHLVLAFCQREFCGGGFVVAGEGRY